MGRPFDPDDASTWPAWKLRFARHIPKDWKAPQLPRIIGSFALLIVATFQVDQVCVIADEFDARCSDHTISFRDAPFGWDGTGVCRKPGRCGSVIRVILFMPRDCVTVRKWPQVRPESLEMAELSRDR